MLWLCFRQHHHKQLQLLWLLQWIRLVSPIKTICKSHSLKAWWLDYLSFFLFLCFLDAYYTFNISIQDPNINYLNVTNLVIFHSHRTQIHINKQIINVKIIWINSWSINESLISSTVTDFSAATASTLLSKCRVSFVFLSPVFK